MTPLDELATLLRPAGGGVYVVSTGRAEQLAMQRRLYGAATEAEVSARFRENLARVAGAKVVLLGVPSDVGAGYVRGANLAPQAIRAALLDEQPSFPEDARARGIVDLGDVFVVPQLLHDDMLTPAQREASARALYPEVDLPARGALPVSPLSIAERALDLVFALNPRVKPVVLGGDHSCAWPVAAALSRVQKEPWGIVQIDAHTDLLEARLGIRYCFATWSFHANDLVGRYFVVFCPSLHPESSSLLANKKLLEEVFKPFQECRLARPNGTAIGSSLYGWFPPAGSIQSNSSSTRPAPIIPTVHTTQTIPRPTITSRPQ